MTSANPSATFDPSAASSYSPICPAIAETNATPIAAAVNNAEIKTNRKDFFQGKKENIVVGDWRLVVGGWRLAPRRYLSTTNHQAPTAKSEPSRSGRFPRARSPLRRRPHYGSNNAN